MHVVKTEILLKKHPKLLHNTMYSRALFPGLLTHILNLDIMHHRLDCRYQGKYTNRGVGYPILKGKLIGKTSIDDFVSFGSFREKNFSANSSMSEGRLLPGQSIIPRDKSGL